jgi:hypothetical protein
VYDLFDTALIFANAKFIIIIIMTSITSTAVRVAISNFGYIHNEMLMLVNTEMLMSDFSSLQDILFFLPQLLHPAFPSFHISEI